MIYVMYSNMCWLLLCAVILMQGEVEVRTLTRSEGVSRSVDEE